jgi:hypothetical protein
MKDFQREDLTGLEHKPSRESAKKLKSDSAQEPLALHQESKLRCQTELRRPWLGLLLLETMMLGPQGLFHRPTSA